MEHASSSQFTKGFFEQFITSKESVACVEANATLTDAAQMMLKKHVGSLVIVDESSGKKNPIGMITDRDITIESVAEELDPNTLSVSDVMTPSLATATLNEDIFSMIAKMKSEGVHRLPVIDETGELVGIVTSKKLVQCLLQGLNDLSALSNQQHQREKEIRH